MHVAAGAIALQTSVPFHRSFFSPFANAPVPPVLFPPKSRKLCESIATSVAPVLNPISPVAVLKFPSAQEMVLLATATVPPNGYPA